MAIPPVSVNVTHSALYCFSGRGKLLWRYDPKLKFRFGDREFSGPWNLTALEIVPEGKGGYVWAAFRHQVWWPSFVVRIDSRGGAEVRFLNAGHIYFLGNIQNTSGNYVLAAGTNNEYNAAVLAVLRTDQPFSWSPQSPDSPYWCRDCGAQVPFQYYRLPKSEMFDLQHQLFHQAVELNVTPEVIRITTFEGNNPGALPNSTSLFGYYEFNRNFELMSGMLCDSYWSLHRTYEKEGKIHHPAAQCPDQTIGTRVRVWIPHFGWNTPRPAALQTRDTSGTSGK